MRPLAIVVVLNVSNIGILVSAALQNSVSFLLFVLASALALALGLVEFLAEAKTRK